jgi:putative flavoprotein involved in K+ transport
MRSSQFKRAVDEFIARSGFVAGPPDSDPLERTLTQPPDAPETVSVRAERIGTVIWCTGFGPDIGWLKVPVLAPDGHIAHTRGLTAFPGLYLVGFPWLSNRGSGILYGVTADAVRIAQHIAGDAVGPIRTPPVTSLSAVPS